MGPFSQETAAKSGRGYAGRMHRSGPLTVARLWEDYGAKLIRFGGVTIVSTVIGLSMFAVGLYVFGFNGVQSNFLSVLASTPPSYMLNRHWVWGKSGESSVSREVGPFWIMALLGFIISTTVVFIADIQTDSRPLLLIAQMCAFGGLWLLKFFFLEKVLWSDRAQPHEHFEPSAR